MTPSLVKFSATQLRQQFSELLVRISGLEGQVAPAEDSPAPIPMYEYLDSYGYTIAAGSNEIQRNLIAERGLNMPR